jgi:hypothetical protein
MESVEWNKGCGHDTLATFAEKVDLEPLFKWAFVRNPWTRLESFYVDSPEAQKATGNNFEQFIDILHEHRTILDPDDLHWWQVSGVTLGDLGVLERIHVYSQFSMLSIGGKMCMDFLGRFESLERDWRTVCEILGVQICTLEHHRRRDEEGTLTWTDGMRHKVAEIYPRDFWS